MNTSSSYVYFALKGEGFEPADITASLGIEPTTVWKKGDKGLFTSFREYTCWELATERGKEFNLIDNLVNEIVAKLENKVETILELKRQFSLNSVLEIVLFVDVNEEQSTPALGHDLRTIDFLYRTQTYTDIDIYRYDSRID